MFVLCIRGKAITSTKSPPWRKLERVREGSTVSTRLTDDNEFRKILQLPLSSRTENIELEARSHPFVFAFDRGPAHP